MRADLPLPDLLKALRKEAGMTQTGLAVELCVLTGTYTLTCNDISRWENGRHRPTEWLPALAEVLHVPLAVLEAAPQFADERDPAVADLSARVAASDVSNATVEAVARATGQLCRAYPIQPPADLLPAVRTRLRQVSKLLDAQATLSQRRDLMVSAGWLSLLAACLHEDLGHRAAANSGADTAANLGHETGHSDLNAWHCEIHAWQGLLDNDPASAISWADAGLINAGDGTSVAAQLTAQKARAYARAGDGPATRKALGQAVSVATRLPVTSESHRHHFTFDPAKMTGYTATTLAWLGDGSQDGEDAAREVVQTSEGPRRIATARLDLGLILAARGELEEAAHQGTLAIESQRLVPSNWWRARDLADLVQPYTNDLTDALRYGP
jgi:transcriptional regulator with XRE-family HTH domain